MDLAAVKTEVRINLLFAKQAGKRCRQARKMSWVYDYYWGKGNQNGANDNTKTHLDEHHQPCIDVKDLDNDEDGD